MDLNGIKNGKRRHSVGMEVVYGKVPPQAKELEQAVLGALMLDSGTVHVAMARLFPEIFYSEANQRIFKAMQQLYDANSKIDLLTVVEKLKANEDLDLVGGSFYVSKLTNDVVSNANIEIHISLIAEKYLKREAIRLGGDLVTEAYEDFSDAFDIINSADAGFQRIQEQVLTGLSKDIGYFGMKVLDEHAQVKETGILGVSTGMKTLDGVICGLVEPDLIIVAARPGIGKTAFALSITYNTSIVGDIPCAWFSLEMNGTQLVRRLVSIHTGINHERIRLATTTKDEDIMIGESIEIISKKKIFIEDKPSINVRDIRTKANLLKKKHGIKYIVVDYIQLMKGIGSNPVREQIVSEISRSLKELAKELQIPIIALSQLSREVEKRSDKIPQLSDIRESGGIEQDADEVIFLMRPEYYGMLNSVEIGGKEYDPLGLSVTSIAKNRHGSTKSIALAFTGPTMHFTDHHLNEIKTVRPEQLQNLPYKDDTPF